MNVQCSKNDLDHNIAFAISHNIEQESTRHPMQPLVEKEVHKLLDVTNVYDKSFVERMKLISKTRIPDPLTLKEIHRRNCSNRSHSYPRLLQLEPELQPKTIFPVTICNIF